MKYIKSKLANSSNVKYIKSTINNKNEGENEPKFEDYYVTKKEYASMCSKYADVCHKLHDLGFEVDDCVTCHTEVITSNSSGYYRHICSNCGEDITSENRYCPFCGRRIIRN